MDRTFKCLQIHNIHIPGFAMATRCNSSALSENPGTSAPQEDTDSRETRLAAVWSKKSWSRAGHGHGRSTWTSFAPRRSQIFMSEHVGTDRIWDSNVETYGNIWKHMESTCLVLFDPFLKALWVSTLLVFSSVSNACKCQNSEQHQRYIASP